MRIVVSGMVAAQPHHGGAVWAVLQYVLGLQRLGHEVHLVEPVTHVDLVPTGATLASSDNAAYFTQVAAAFGLAPTATLVQAEGHTTVGLPWPELVALTRGADLLLNLSGLLVDDELVAAIPLRVYVDLDPAFTQLWHTAEGIDMGFEGHTHFVTVGQSLGRPGNGIPTCGREWITTLPPVVLSWWPAVPSAPDAPVTTVANWRGYGSIVHEGVHHGQKAHALRPVASLPRLTEARLVLALAIHGNEEADRALLVDHGWGLVDPAAVAGGPLTYRQFIQGSAAEIGVAKTGYVVSRSGWFSDRSACYLASGKPVVAQDTGFSEHLPVGDGLLAFDDLEGARSGLEQVRRDHSRHAAAARALACSHLDSDLVLTRLLTHLGAT